MSFLMSKIQNVAFRVMEQRNLVGWTSVSEEHIISFGVKERWRQYAPRNYPLSPARIQDVLIQNKCLKTFLVLVI
jgi:hypothetical protein